MPSVFVLTGGPSAGKTTILGELARRGFPVIEEAARAVILEGVHHPLRDPLAFQREVLRRQIALEAAAPPGRVFADRGIGDHFGYLEHYRTHRGIDFLAGEFGLDLEKAWQDAVTRYRAVFLVEPSPRFAPAIYRRESPAEALAIHDAVVSAYRSRHPVVIDVPWGPLGERVERILAILDTFKEHSPE